MTAPQICKCSHGHHDHYPNDAKPAGGRCALCSCNAFQPPEASAPAKPLPWHATPAGPFTSERWIELLDDAERALDGHRVPSRQAAADVLMPLVERFGIAPAPDGGPCTCGAPWEQHRHFGVDCPGYHLATLDVLYQRQGEELEAQRQRAFTAEGHVGRLQEQAEILTRERDASDKASLRLEDQLLTAKAEVDVLTDQQATLQATLGRRRADAERVTRERDEARKERHASALCVCVRVMGEHSAYLPGEHRPMTPADLGKQLAEAQGDGQRQAGESVPGVASLAGIRAAVQSVLLDGESIERCDDRTAEEGLVRITVRSPHSGVSQRIHAAAFWACPIGAVPRVLIRNMDGTAAECVVAGTPVADPDATERRVKTAVAKALDSLAASAAAVDFRTPGRRMGLSEQLAASVEHPQCNARVIMDRSDAEKAGATIRAVLPNGTVECDVKMGVVAVDAPGITRESLIPARALAFDVLHLAMQEDLDAHEHGTLEPGEDGAVTSRARHLHAELARLFTQASDGQGSAGDREPPEDSHVNRIIATIWTPAGKRLSWDLPDMPPEWLLDMVDRLTAASTDPSGARPVHFCDAPYLYASCGAPSFKHRQQTPDWRAVTCARCLETRQAIPPVHLFDAYTRAACCGVEILRRAGERATTDPAAVTCEACKGSPF